MEAYNATALNTAAEMLILGEAGIMRIVDEARDEVQAKVLGILVASQEKKLRDDSRAILTEAGDLLYGVLLRNDDDLIAREGDTMPSRPDIQALHATIASIILDAREKIRKRWNDDGASFAKGARNIIANSLLKPAGRRMPDIPLESKPGMEDPRRLRLIEQEGRIARVGSAGQIEEEAKRGLSGRKKDVGITFH